MSLKNTEILEQRKIETAPCGCWFQVVRFGPERDDPPPSLFGPPAQRHSGGWGWLQFDNPQVSDCVLLVVGSTEDDARRNALLSLRLSAAARA